MVLLPEYYFSMNKNKNRKIYVITGATALFISLAGQVQAIPIPVSQNPDAAPGSPHPVGSIHGIARDNLVMTRINPVTLLTSESRKAAVTAANRAAAKKPSKKLAEVLTPPMVSPVTLSPVDRNTLVANVPDGGASVVMLSGAFSVLFFLKRKSAA